MIGKVAGVLDYRAADHVLVDAGGIGYIVYCGERTLASLPPPGERVALFTELVVREDLLQLYGFPTLVEREWHRLLTSVQGVGARGALAILAALGADGVARAIALGDVISIRRAPGIGPKIAERVARELKDRVPGLMAMGGAGARPASAAATLEGREPVTAAAGAAALAASVSAQDAVAVADALSALINLGYGHGEAAGSVASAAAEAPEAGTAELIRLALRRLVPKG